MYLQSSYVPAPPPIVKDLDPVFIQYMNHTSIQSLPITSLKSSKPERKILVIGQTGHGKTSFVNAMFNFLYNKDPSNFIYICDFPNGNFQNFGIPAQSPRDIELFNQREEYKKKVENGEGITEQCYRYNCNNQFIIYDTPGLSDGKGIEHDDKNIVNILKEASSAGHLNAIIYVINSTTCRMDPAIVNSINRLASIIPNEFSTSVLVVNTFCRDGRTQVKDSWLPFTARKTFFLDTNLFSYTSEEFKEFEKKINKCWEKCKKVLNEIKNEIDIMNNKRVEEFKFLYNEHNRAKARFTELKLGLKNILILKEALIKNKNLYDNYSKFYKDIEIPIKEMIETNYHNTNCMLCYSTCHEGCHLELIIENGSIKFNDCACMNSDKKCRECSCDHKQHYHDFKKNVKSKKTIKKMIENLRGMPENQLLPEEIEISEFDRVRLEIEKQERDFKTIEEEVKTKKSDLVNTAVMMKHICPKFNMQKQILIEIDFIDKKLTASNAISVEESIELQEWKKLLHSLQKEMQKIYSQENRID